MRGALYFGTGVVNRDRQPDTPHDDHVSQIVSRICHLIERDPALGGDFFKNRNLFDVALIDIGHFHLARALFGRRRDASADYAGLNAVPTEPLERDAVLRIEHFALDHFSVGAGNVEKTAVGENAVDVHDEHSDLGRALAEFGSNGHLQKPSPGQTAAPMARSSMASRFSMELFSLFVQFAVKRALIRQQPAVNGSEFAPGLESGPR